MRALPALLALMAAGTAYAGDIPDKYTQLHDKAVSDPAAMKQLQALAEKGDSYAQYCFAGLYNPDATECKQDTLAEQKVMTVKPDLPTAAKWYKLAALQGDDLAAEELGTMYLSDEKPFNDVVQAAQWWMVAIYIDPNGPGGFNATIALGSASLTDDQAAQARAGAHKIEARIKRKKH